MFNVYSIENQNFYLDGGIISGVQSVGISYNNNTQASIRVTDPNLNYFVSAPVIADVDVNYILSNNDRFINYTGAGNFSGKLEYGDKYFTFSSGYLTNYSLSYKLGAYPSVNTRSLILGELGNTSGTFSYQPKLLNNFDVGDTCYVDLNLNDANTNRLEAFNIDIDTPREAVYTIGNYLPDNVIIKYPINISLNFEFSMSEYNQEKVTNIFTGITQKNLNLSFRKYNTNELLLTLNLSNLVNSETQLNYSINDEAKLTLNFNTYILSGLL